MLLNGICVDRIPLLRLNSSPPPEGLRVAEPVSLISRGFIATVSLLSEAFRDTLSLDLLLEYLGGRVSGRYSTQVDLPFFS